jgi:hypothetical protein
MTYILHIPHRFQQNEPGTALPSLKTYTSLLKSTQLEKRIQFVLLGTHNDSWFQFWQPYTGSLTPVMHAIPSREACHQFLNVYVEAKSNPVLNAFPHSSNDGAAPKRQDRAQANALDAGSLAENITGMMILLLVTE